MKTLRWILCSNLLLAVVAIQVFLQVWLHVTDAPVIGLFISLWLSFKLGGLAGYADITQEWVDHAQAIAADIAEFQAWFEGLPVAEQLKHAEEWAVVMLRLTTSHQKCIALRDRPYDPPSMFWLLLQIPNPLRYFARRRARKIMATAKVVHS